MRILSNSSKYNFTITFVFFQIKSLMILKDRKYWKQINDIDRRCSIIRRSISMYNWYHGIPNFDCMIMVLHVPWQWNLHVRNILELMELNGIINRIVTYVQYYIIWFWCNVIHLYKYIKIYIQMVLKTKIRRKLFLLFLFYFNNFKLHIFLLWLEID